MGLASCVYRTGPLELHIFLYPASKVSAAFYCITFICAAHLRVTRGSFGAVLIFFFKIFWEAVRGMIFHVSLKIIGLGLLLIIY
jgi:hypothetical protein